MARATNSLPVPVSPRMSTVVSVGATRSTCRKTDLRVELSPIIPSSAPEKRESALLDDKSWIIVLSPVVCTENMIDLPENHSGSVSRSLLQRCVDLPKQSLSSHRFIQKAGCARVHQYIAQRRIS